MPVVNVCIHQSIDHLRWDLKINLQSHHSPSSTGHPQFFFSKAQPPIYTFAKHSFIINKSPFCIKTGMLQPWHFTVSQPKATTQLAKTAGGNTLISLCKGDPSDNGETRMKKSSRPQKYLQVENNNKHV